MHMCITVLAHLMTASLYKLTVACIHKSLFKHSIFIAFIRHENSHLDRIPVTAAWKHMTVYETLLLLFKCALPLTVICFP